MGMVRGSRSPTKVGVKIQNFVLVPLLLAVLSHCHPYFDPYFPGDSRTLLLLHFNLSGCGGCTSARTTQPFRHYKFQHFEEVRKPRDEIFESNSLIKTTPFRRSEFKVLITLLASYQSFIASHIDGGGSQIPIKW